MADNKAVGLGVRRIETRLWRWRETCCFQELAMATTLKLLTGHQRFAGGGLGHPVSRPGGERVCEASLREQVWSSRRVVRGSEPVGRHVAGPGTARWLVCCALILPAAILPAWPALGLEFPGPDPGKARAMVDGDRFTLENSALAVSWQLSKAGGLRLLAIEERLSGTRIARPGEVFEVELAGGRKLVASQLEASGPVQVETVPADRGSVRRADHCPGKRVQVVFQAPEGGCQLEWSAELRDGSNYVRQFLRLRAGQASVPIDRIVLVDFQHPRAVVAGSVMGSPVVAGQMFFAYEHPNAASQVEAAGSQSGRLKRVRSFLDRRMPPPAGRELVQSSVVGVAPAGQMRRALLYYLERERARPYRLFLHYNSWWDIASGKLMTEAECLEVIHCFGRELTRQREVAMDSFVFDDGWDDPKTLWGFHDGFPQGFAPLRDAAARYASRVGVWLSPWGGYGQAKKERLAYGRAQGFETNRNGFTLAGPKYYARFRDVCAKMIRDYGVNYFKFDGVGIGNDRDGAPLEFLPDIEGLMRLTRELRRLRPDVYLSITTGTWPSPFWLFYGDSVWRNGHDAGVYGAGSERQQWITYRDMIVRRMIVDRAPLYPLNSLMTVTVTFARRGLVERLGIDAETSPDVDDLTDEIRMAFGSGTQLLELYVTPQRMTPRAWDVLAECARWARANADVLVDVHWVGGDPGKGEPYGYAAWSPRKGILTLRNPGAREAALALDVAQAFELPPGAARRYALRSPWRDDAGHHEIFLEAGRAHRFQLAPFEALVLEAIPAEPVSP